MKVVQNCLQGITFVDFYGEIDKKFEWWNTLSPLHSPIPKICQKKISYYLWSIQRPSFSWGMSNTLISWTNLLCIPGAYEYTNACTYVACAVGGQPPRRVWELYLKDSHSPLPPFNPLERIYLYFLSINGSFLILALLTLLRRFNPYQVDSLHYSTDTILWGLIEKSTKSAEQQEPTQAMDHKKNRKENTLRSCFYLAFNKSQAFPSPPPGIPGLDIF